MSDDYDLGCLKNNPIWSILTFGLSHFHPVLGFRVGFNIWFII